MTLDPRFLDRFDRAIGSRYAEMEPEFVRVVRAMEHKHAAKGSIRSPAHYNESLRNYSRELEARIVVAWEAAVRVHRTVFASDLTHDLRADLKALIRQVADRHAAALGEHFNSRTVKLLGQPKLNDEPLNDRYRLILEKHDLEVDLYVDNLELNAEKGQVSVASYHFYGSVGAVQTGAHAVANTVQNIGEGGRADLLAAIEKVHEALLQAGEHLGDRKRDELVQLADDASKELKAPEPNNTRLMTVFMTLATTVQTIPNARPAYEALKAALLPLGVTLP